MTLLYHYCSNHAFHSIIEKQEIWLSLLSLSNDWMEGKLVTKTLALMAETDGLSETDTDCLRKTASKLLEEVFDGFSFCLSAKSDLLSQWWRYAEDATGVSIGFCKENLEKYVQKRSKGALPLTFQRVEYDTETQESLIKPAYTKIKELINGGAFNAQEVPSISDVQKAIEVEDETNFKASLLSMEMTGLFTKLFLLKSNAFREEDEWRLVSYFVKKGGTCLFRAVKDRIIPFRKCLCKPESNLIVEVILGPKNKTPDYVVDSFLRQSGFIDVKISRSEISYR